MRFGVVFLIVTVGCAPLTTISMINKAGQLSRCKVESSWFIQTLIDKCGDPRAVIPETESQSAACALYETMNTEADSPVRAIAVCMDIDMYAVFSPPPLKNGELAPWVKPKPTGFKREPFRGKEWLRVKEVHGLTRDAFDKVMASSLP